MADLGLRNLTANDRTMLKSIGITTKAQFQKLGAHKIIILLEDAGQSVDRDLIYRLRGAEDDVDWKILAERARRRAKSRFADVDEP